MIRSNKENQIRNNYNIKDIVDEDGRVLFELTIPFKEWAKCDNEEDVEELLNKWTFSPEHTLVDYEYDVMSSDEYDIVIELKARYRVE